ncbi:hypothetical protein CERZMDRAFT_116314 [Cercospora zeae-maydis SCOH1-5]|uniref:F-box domain-containing protein n=1 Tax=Cercospora zeae-maydis SCOH1-5 TaxID=717836 RepID=A0A6A6FVD7_9PEZI|nr:hypothetical protein CERZMDRAFT_116314 [Cercospora zeae-maydis SCOH1-5]
MLSYLSRRLAQIGTGHQIQLQGAPSDDRIIPSATIHDLPAELLVEISKYIPEQSDLYSLCVASKPLGSAATPCLYHSIIVDRDARRLHKLVRTLSRAPSLAKHIKCIQLHLPAEGNIATPARADLISFLEFILPLASHDSWFHRKLANALRRGSYDGFAILLLLLATEVDEMDLAVEGGRAAFLQANDKFNCQRFSDLVATLITWTASSDPTQANSTSSIVRPKSALSNVQKLRFFPDVDSECIEDELSEGHSQAVYPFEYMSLPRLEDLQAYGSAPWHDISPNYGQANAHITRLHLDWVSMDSENVGLAIQTCHKLVELHVSWDHSVLDLKLSSESIDLDNIRPALNQHADTLERLELLFSAEDIYPVLVRGDIGALSHFSALEILRIDETFLFSSEVSDFIFDWEPLRSFQRASGVLPPNLKEFWFESRKHTSAATVYEVLTTIGTMLPVNLSYLRVSFGYTHNNDGMDHADCCHSLSFHSAVTGVACRGTPTVPYHMVLTVNVDHRDSVLTGLREATTTDLMKALREGLGEEGGESDE